MIKAIFAIDESNGLGKDGGMPWPLNKEDLQWFKRTTENQVVVMGKKTWDSTDIPKPLPNRQNVVITNEFLERTDIDQIRGDICQGLTHFESKNDNLDVFVIGGANILTQAKPVIDYVYITRIQGSYQCDTILDLDDFLTGFKLVEIIELGTCKVEAYEAV